MTKQEVRSKLSKFSNGGNTYLLLDYLLDQKYSVIEISQEQLAKDLHKTRPAIQSSLQLLKKLKLLNYSYGKITMIQEIL